jgi:DNA-directed RNA polymerase specialized sigma24 family protein
MDDSQGEGTRTRAAEELILRTIAAHADSLLRTARRHSLCADDAHDAYQRAIEIFMTRAHRLDDGRAPGWLHVVVKREAQAICSDRRRLLLGSDGDLDTRESLNTATPEEQLLSFDLVSRSAEALKRLRPNELRALWLRAQGHSYSEIQAMTGWSYTKVNRCMTEGRRSFLERYAGIESGAECERWLPAISALADGEASSDDVLDLRPHLRNCPGCRATLRALRESSTPLSAVLPVPLIAVESGGGTHVLDTFVRLYEGVAGSVHERAVHSVTKAQALIEASVSGKVAAVAASAAAVAGGGYASVERVVDEPRPPRAAAQVRSAPVRSVPARVNAAVVPAVASKVAPSIRRVVEQKQTTISRAATSQAARRASEFRPKTPLAADSASFHTARTAKAQDFTPPPPPPAPARSSSTAPEFGATSPVADFGP